MSCWSFWGNQYLSPGAWDEVFVLLPQAGAWEADGGAQEDGLGTPRFAGAHCFHIISYNFLLYLLVHLHDSTCVYIMYIVHGWQAEKENVKVSLDYFQSKYQARQQRDASSFHLRVKYHFRWCAERPLRRIWNCSESRAKSTLEVWLGESLPRLHASSRAGAQENPRTWRPAKRSWLCLKTDFNIFNDLERSCLVGSFSCLNHIVCVLLRKGVNASFWSHMAFFLLAPAEFAPRAVMSAPQQESMAPWWKGLASCFGREFISCRHSVGLSQERIEMVSGWHSLATRKRKAKLVIWA